MKKASFKEAMVLWAKPERVVLITSKDTTDTPCVMTVAWIMRASFRPPIFAISVGKERRMHSCLMHAREFVVAVPGKDMAKETILCGTPSDEDVDRFEQCHFRIKPGNFVAVPLIENCIANFECKVVGQMDSGDHTIFAGEVQASWVSDESSQNLLVIGEESGYTLLAEDGPYRIGVVRA